jgi:hypothetical protein
MFFLGGEQSKFEEEKVERELEEARQRLINKADLFWDGDTVWFSGIDREWLAEIKIDVANGR